VHDRADEGLELREGLQSGAVDEHGADLEDLALVAGDGVEIVAGRLEVDDEIVGGGS